MADNYVNRLKLKVAILMLRLYTRPILDCYDVIFKVFMTKLQILFLHKYKDRNIARLNKLAHVITLHFLHGDIPEHYKSLREEERTLIDSEISELSNLPELMHIAANYYRTLGFLYAQSYATEKSEEILKKAIQYDSSATALTTEEFTHLNKAIKKEYKFARKEYKKNLKEFLAGERYRLLEKIEILPSHITFIASVSATIFLLTGYLYNKFYLGAFGIEVSKFFTLSDYITTSIDKIYIAGIATMFAVGAYIFGMYKSLEVEVERVHFESETRVPKYTLYVAMCSLSGITFIRFYKNLPGKYSSLCFIIALALLILYHKLPIDKLFKNSTFISIFCVAFIFFAANIISEVASDIDRIHRYSATELKKYEFNFNRSFPMNQATIILLADTGKDMFFYDTESKSTYVIPRSAVNWVKSVQPE